MLLQDRNFAHGASRLRGWPGEMGSRFHFRPAALGPGRQHMTVRLETGRTMFGAVQHDNVGCASLGVPRCAGEAADLDIGHGRSQYTAWLPAKQVLVSRSFVAVMPHANVPRNEFGKAASISVDGSVAFQCMIRPFRWIGSSLATLIFVALGNHGHTPLQ